MTTPSVTRLRRLVEARKRGAAKTQEAVQRNDERRLARRAPGATTQAKARAVQQREEAEPVDIQIKPKDVEAWFRDRAQEFMGFQVLLSAWSSKEQALARQVLDTYGPELSRQAIEWMFGNWADVAPRN